MDGILQVILLCLISSISTKTLYRGDKIVEVNIPSKWTWIQVHTLLKDTLRPEHLDIWRLPNEQAKTAHLVVREGDFQKVAAAFEEAGIEFKVKNDDLQRLIDLEDERLKVNKQQTIVGTYARYDDMLEYMLNITHQYPELASMLSIGLTYEGRETWLIKIGGLSPNPWKIWVEGGMHAREWISPASVIYIIDQLIQGYNNGDPNIVEYLENFEFHIIPVANPDGYEYCHTNERLWRKNRRPNEGTSCVGVDLNRNWDFQWGGASADDDPCSNLYMGPSPGSEPEVQNIVNHILPEAQTYIMYLAYHAWGQQFFTRWDYTDEEVPEDHEELLDLAQRSVDAMIAQHGLFWEAGIAPDLMYAFAGGSADWARGVANIKYPYLLELRDDGDYQFELPPDQIIPQGEEVWAGLLVILEEILLKWGDVPPPNPSK